ncbi:hypothetical protein B0H15DRAFT_946059 [Mycena belliarum]|uniref:Uncharacterized protein n=1 Tax=Mycena belliarum TaxID=1033014 RepID=A0AAD6UBW6_9AGAR|nr:hypothetical protein B0H15DRAFT_946059 [Mycena belliae]
MAASVDALVAATSSLSLSTNCVPRLFLLPDDPPVEELLRVPKHKFYIITRGKSSDAEGIYSSWTLASPRILGVSNVQHESCANLKLALKIWAAYCRQWHDHPIQVLAPPSYNSPAPSLACPPPGSGLASPPSSPVACPAQTPPSTPRKYYRIPGSPRVLVDRKEAERELRKARATSLLLGSTLADIEDDDDGPATPTSTPSTPSKFYRVFGSRRIQTDREAAIAELAASRATGLLLGDSLEAVEGPDA